MQTKGPTVATETIECGVLGEAAVNPEQELANLNLTKMIRFY